MSLDDSLPTDLASAHALIIAQRQALSEAELRAAAAENEAQHRALLIEKLKFTIRKLRHDRFGQSSERGSLLDQLELQLADLEADATQAETVVQMATTAGSDRIACMPSRDARQHVAHCPSICRGNGLSIRRPRHARAAAVRPCVRSART